MELSQRNFSSTLLDSPTLVVSRDPALGDQLRRILEVDHQHTVELARSYREAEGFVQRRLPHAVFLDLRIAGAEEDPSCLLREPDRARPGSHAGDRRDR